MHQPVDKKRLATLTLAALGIVYGDIGTSPLYSVKEVFGGAHHPVPITPDNVLGILSLFFWSLIIVVTIKYVGFIMRANNKGEGGIIALMTLALQDGKAGSWPQKLLVTLGLFGAALFALLAAAALAPAAAQLYQHLEASQSEAVQRSAPAPQGLYAIAPLW